MFMDDLESPINESRARNAPPRLGVIICECGGQISRVIDPGSLCSQAKALPGVVWASHEAYPCSKDGQARLKEAIIDHDLERVLVAGCSPRLTRNLFRSAAVEAGLTRDALNMANIREQCAYIHSEYPETALAKAAGLIEMGAARLSATSFTSPRSGRVLKSVVILGSDLSALTMALTLAEAGFQVRLVERSGGFGEASPVDLHKNTLRLTIDKGQAVIQHPLIETYLNSSVLEMTGHPGEYEVRVRQGDQELSLSAGAVVATHAAYPKRLGADQWFDRQRVKTQAEFESELESFQEGQEPFALKDLIFILCADPEQREKCSRVCCNIGIRQAIQAKLLTPEANVTILFRDLYLGGIAAAHENELHEARKLGVTFFRYRKEQPPVIGSHTVDVLDPLTGEPLKIPFDRVVMSMPLMPQTHTQKLASLLGLPLDDDGFLAEPRLRLRPGRYAERGIFVLGSSQQPVDADEALFQAYLTSARVARFLTKENIYVETPAAHIDPAMCTGCGNCPQVCPASAIHLEKTDGVLSRSEVDDLRCIGCGNCVVVCPTKAITLPGWDNVEIPVQIQSVLESRSFQKDLPRVVVLACEWSAYASADLAGARYHGSHHPDLIYPANVRIIRMNCSARFDPFHILWAFLNGADGVFLGACPPGECHYGSGNLYAQERVEVLQKLLGQHGMDPNRLHLEFMGVDDGPKFSRSLTQFVRRVGELGARTKQPVS
jgi:heterodisulfide reductase subunit A2